MPNINDMFPSKYLKASDVAEEDLTLTIKEVKQETMKDKDGTDIQKPVLFFTEHDKGMVMNVTNAKVIASLYGDNSEDWSGKKVILYYAEVDAFGETKPAIRVKKQKPVADRETLMKHFTSLYEKASKLKVEKVEQYQLKGNAPAEEILAMGKKLRAAIEAVESFQ